MPAGFAACPCLVQVTNSNRVQAGRRSIAHLTPTISRTSMIRAMACVEPRSDAPDAAVIRDMFSPTDHHRPVNDIVLTQLRSSFSNKGPKYHRNANYSGSFGLLNNAPSLILPCPTCGKSGSLRSPGSRFEAVSSGGKTISELKNSITSLCFKSFFAANRSRADCASPPCLRITSVSVMLLPSWP